MKDLFKFHGHFITTGLSNDTLILSSLLSFTALSAVGNLAYAQLIFNQIKSPNVFMYNTMIRAYVNKPVKALLMYRLMFSVGVCPNNFTFPFVVKGLSRFDDYRYGESVHGTVIKFGYFVDLHVVNSILHMYASFGFSSESVKLFGEIPEPDVVSWNVVIDGLAQCGCFDEVLGAFDEMVVCGVEPSSVTLLGLVSACTKSGDLGVGRLIHLYIVKKEVQVSGNLGNGLLHMYVKFGDMDSAEKLFDRMNVKTVFSWTSMIDGYMQKGDRKSANVFFVQMPEKDVTAWNVMLNGFVVGNDLTAAELIFREAPERDVVSWNCMIAGYAQNKNFTRSLELFKEMLIADFRPDRITIASLLAVCGFAGALYIGEAVHSIMKKQNITGEEVEVALMDMYSKCGAPERAMKSFDGISTKSVLAWSAMIVGLAMNGLSKEALDFFAQMQNEDIKPNEVTFIGVLSACSYAGWVEEGRRLYDAMSEVYGIMPRSEHFGCMVDILARAGLLEEAEIFIQNLPVKADAGVWGALLGGCRLHNDVQMGEKVAEILTELDPSHSGRYILLSNIYAADSRWTDAEKVRKKMRISGVQKTPGYSLIEQSGEIHQFLVGDAS
ncbi:Pentatricopeptide repeat-containing protein [Heracleum sosnowskyi]|uniref:Pentatricopeptide repeat-containing protein n=1 Tax=Heracleum sosnowskyi TaxID=360622 RepID=A0AAD8J934_9APIA|nr:Pentatricopeptide repeat-containing protein [Heracleum sosnowskyi]